MTTLLRSATVYNLLISCPGDITSEDLGTVTEVINRWNVIYGPAVNAAIVPVRWELHSAAAYGERTQASLNEQLVKDADIVIALFWHRLGSPTGEAESGTIEEIETAHGNGAYVGILRCTRDIPQDAADPDQLQRLRDYLGETRSRSVILEYNDNADLARHVDTILNTARAQLAARAEAAVEARDSPPDTPHAGADVWPHVESSEQVRTDAKGRVRTERRWELVLANVGTEPARTVQHRLEPENESDDMPFLINEGERPLEVLAPKGEARYELAMHMGVAPQARCVVTWEDSTGAQENRATLRFF
jgi:hypothetical protein